MSNTEIRAVTGPINYFSHPGNLSGSNDLFSADQLSRAVWVYGERAISMARLYLPEAFHPAEAKRLLPTGHYNETDVAQLVKESGEDRGVVTGVGGGTLLDTAKVLARHLDLPFVGVPIITATCAAWMPLSAWRNDTGQALHFKIFTNANFPVLVEPEIVLNTPEKYLLVGVGGTLAKWYEAVVFVSQPETLPLVVRLGIQTAQTIRDVPLEGSEQALTDRQQDALSRMFCDVVDAIIAGGGMIDGLSERYTRMVAVHSAHNGLTAFPQTEKFLHGTRVAYDALVQNVLLGQDVVLTQLITAYRRFNLPTRLAQLEVDINSRAEIDKVITHTLHPVESIHALPIALTPETLRVTFERVESLTA